MKSDLKGPIAWMAQNHVAANLLMMICLIGGLIMLMSNMKQEVFPEIDTDYITITVPYPGASPEEVENGVILAIEEAVDGIDGIKKITSTASEGVAVVYVELYSDADDDKVSTDIKNEVDRITTLPADAEDPNVELLNNKSEVIQLAVYGDVEESVLKELAETMRDDLLQDPVISQVDLESVRPIEISIEVPQETLRHYNLTMDQVAQAVRASAIELPGGEVKSEAGKVLLRTKDRRDWAKEFEDIVVVRNAEGSGVTLGQIANITDDFEDIEFYNYYNGYRTAMLKVYRVGKQTPVEVARAVKDYQKDLEAQLPEGVYTATWADMSEIYEDRIGLLVKNAKIGLVLVFVFLGLFLHPSLAFWVTMGIPISFMGAFLFLPGLGVSINMISLFAFIVTLGIVVDDAIVVGENIFEHRQSGDDRMLSSIRGAREVAMPVTFSILTTVAAFSPLLFVQGAWGQIMRNIPLVVITILLISLFESLYILPAHLGHLKMKRKDPNRLERFQLKFANGIVAFAENVYGPAVKWCVRNRWQTFAVGIAVLLIAIGFVKGGRVNIRPMPEVESDWVVAEVELAYDAPIQDAQKIRSRLEQSAKIVVVDNGGDEIIRGLITWVESSKVSVVAFLETPDKRDINVNEFSNAWREEVGVIPGIESMKIAAAKLGPGGGHSAIEVQLSHRDITTLEKAATELAERMQGYSGVIDINDGFTAGKPQFDFQLTPEGRSLGLTNFELGRQVRNAFYGVEAFSQQRGRDTVKVMVRLPEEQRRNIYDVEDLMIRTAEGGELPLSQAASLTRGTSYTSIKRSDRKRSLTVGADIEKGSGADLETILSSLTIEELPDLVRKYPGLSYSFEGDKRSSGEAMGSLFSGFVVALLVMYCLVAIPFRSYIQSWVVLLAIPFGFVGALIGHLIMGYNLSLMSMFGLVALSGVVINDSLVLVHKANELRKSGMPLQESIEQAGIRRFRPIVLTSMTTFLGLMPMILETSLQARFLIPMALSLGFGVLFATLITLLLVPAFYMIEVDVKELVFEVFGDAKRIFRRNQ